MATVSSLLNYLGALPQSLMVVDEDDNDIALTVTSDRVVVSFPTAKGVSEAQSDQLVFFEPHNELSELAAKSPMVVSKESRTDDPENFKDPERAEDPLDDDPQSPGNRKQETLSISPDSATHTPKESVDGTDVSKDSKNEETQKAAKQASDVEIGTGGQEDKSEEVEDKPETKRTEDKKSETMKEEPSKAHNTPPTDKSKNK